MYQLTEPIYSEPLSLQIARQNFIGSLTRAFDLRFFLESLSPGPLSILLNHINFLQKFEEIFADHKLSPVSLTSVNSLSSVSATPAINTKSQSTL